MQKLSKKGVLFLTAGFHQLYVLQNITHLIEKNSEFSNTPLLKIILSDGEIYVSGIYQIKSSHQLQKCQKIREFDILKIAGNSQGFYQPILISSLQILSQNHLGIYGTLPISLFDYFSSKMTSNQTLSSIQQKNCHFGNSQINFVASNEPIRELQTRENSLDQKIYKDFLPNMVNQEQKKTNFYQNLSLQSFLFESIRPTDQKYSNKVLQKSQQSQNMLTFQNQTIQQNHKKDQKNILKQLDSYPQKKFKLNQNFQEQMSQKIKSQDLTQIQLKNQPNYPQNTQLNQKRKNLVQNAVLNNLIDLDEIPTQKQIVSLYHQSQKKVTRTSHLNFLGSMLQSEEKGKQTQKLSLKYANNDQSITIPQSQTFPQPCLTPLKSNDPIKFDNPIKSSLKLAGTTTQKKKIKQEYNLLIENLYQSNQSFKIICRVNYLYQWKSVNDVPCLALNLMDSQGDQIRAIVYMNHSSKDCFECANIVEVGKVYCFQNGECRRDIFQKQGLELVFNLKARLVWSQDVTCGGKNKIIPTKLKIQPFFEHRVVSISKMLQNFQSGKNQMLNVYGLIEALKISQYESKIKRQKPEKEQQQDSSEVQIIEPLNNFTSKSAKKPQNNSKNFEGFSKLYLSGYLADPIEMKKINFALILSKLKSDTNQLAKDFLQNNLIKKDALIVLHNVKLHPNSNKSVFKLEKTKRTYLQVMSQQPYQWKYNKLCFAAQVVDLTQDSQNQTLYWTFAKIFKLSTNELETIYQNPRFINYSQQPYTSRTIRELIGLLNNSIVADESCFSELKDVTIYSIEQKQSVSICYYCKKKLKISQNSVQCQKNRIKRCQRCKNIVKAITMHVFKIVFADNTASFQTQVVKDDYIQIIIGRTINEFLSITEEEKIQLLQLVKYNQFILKLRSQLKANGIIHKINSIETLTVKAKIDEIKTERKGVKKHYQNLQSSW